jgi:hypothetical protein
MRKDGITPYQQLRKFLWDEGFRQQQTCKDERLEFTYWTKDKVRIVVMSFRDTGGFDVFRSIDDSLLIEATFQKLRQAE